MATEVFPTQCLVSVGLVPSLAKDHAILIPEPVLIPPKILFGSISFTNSYCPSLASMMGLASSAGLEAITPWADVSLGLHPSSSFQEPYSRTHPASPASG